MKSILMNYDINILVVRICTVKKLNTLYFCNYHLIPTILNIAVTIKFPKNLYFFTDLEELDILLEAKEKSILF